MEGPAIKEFLRFIGRFERERRSFALVSLLKQDGAIAKAIYSTEGGLIASVGDWQEASGINISRVIEQNANESITKTESEGSSFRLVIERVYPKISMLVMGAGHVGQAIALSGHMLGYKVSVFDDRKEFLTPERFNGVDIELRNMSFNNLDISQWSTTRTAVVIVTRGHQYDEQCLRAFIEYDLDYIGMIGSRRRVLSVFERLIKDGVDPERLEKVRAPIGLRIGARSPQEIAVSVLAEIIQVMNSPLNHNEREHKKR